METTFHTMTDLFDQLGLPSDRASIIAFIEKHKPMCKKVPVDKQAFWSGSQSAFLKEAQEADADWIEIVDELNARLHR